jgi:hypothetical protein
MRRLRIPLYSFAVVFVALLLIQSMSAQTIQSLRVLGTTSIATAKTSPGGGGGVEVSNAAEVDLKDAIARALGFRIANLVVPGKSSLAPSVLSSALPLPQPTAHGLGVQSSGSRSYGWSGLTHFDQRFANNGNQFSLEPPDQGLCAGNGYVLESVNDVMRVYDRSGNALTNVVDMNSFFGLAPAIDRVNIIFGPFLSDPKCIYDPDTHRWFLTELMEDNGTNAGASFRNFTLVAVSQSSDPTGLWTVFAIDATDDGANGTPANPGCPCFGDQPLIGANRNGFYVSTNEFGNGFNGAQIYAVSKQGLALAANGGPLPSLVHINAGPALNPYDGISYSVQPAVSPNGGENNVEYFLSALQFGNPGYEVYDNRIAVWALSGTSTLDRSTPNVKLAFQVISSETYGQPDPAAQKPGPTPLGTALGEPLEMVDTNDDRMNQVVYAGETLYGALNSKLSVAGADQTGTAWFRVAPNFDDGRLHARVIGQGYVAVTGNNVIFPSIATNSDGNGIIAFTLVGPDYYPSAAYVNVRGNGTKGPVYVAGAGVGPEDGFTGYPEYGGDGSARWGDYSAAFVDGNSIWFANEYIPGGPRSSLANWGTFVSTVRTDN